MPHRLFLGLTFIILAACSTADSNPSRGDPLQGALPGTCEGACGQQSADGCWCDDQCEGFGDCCGDYDAVCNGGAPAGTCAASCGGQAPAGCWCNEQCEGFGDCCDDYQELCVDDPGDPGDPGSDPWSDLSGSALVTALRSELSSIHNGLSYDNARNHMYGVQGSGIDVHDGVLEGIYTGVTAVADGTRTPGTLNTEHSWPRSDGAANFPAEGDLHHLFPSDTEANSRRGSHEFGETTCSGAGCPWAEGGSELGTDGSGATVFQVRSKYRGDVARAHFYFSVRYALAISGGEEEVLRGWHAQDPPSDEERARNDAIESVQGNRNPFIDYPQLSERVGDF